MNSLAEEELKYETVVLGGGCFWCTEAVFKMLKGVVSVEPGYADGETENPIYEEVASGATGYAEVVRIKFDPKIISFEHILTVFFATHDPTSLNRQGNDVGSQYRSIILCTMDKQKKIAKKFINDINLSDSKGKPIVTEVKHLEVFHEAEHFHKDYYEKNKDQSYCQVVINPKLEKVKEKFSELLKK